MAKPPPDESPFDRFLRLGTAIFAVPKDEVAKQMAAKKKPQSEPKPKESQ